jgi:hypothetical protein
MNTDDNEIMDDLNTLTKVSLDIPVELYERAIAMAREEGLSLDQWVNRILKDEFTRKPILSSATQAKSSSSVPIREIRG